MRYLGMAILAAIGLFTGGCSLLFLSDFGLDSLVLVFAIPGLIISGLCIWGIRALLRPT